jgi:hypothetical protein
MLWTVVRFPNGSWSYGGKPDAPDYAECEVWRIDAGDGKSAVRKAQTQRYNASRRKKVEPVGAERKAP